MLLSKKIKRMVSHSYPKGALNVRSSFVDPLNKKCPRTTLSARTRHLNTTSQDGKMKVDRIFQGIFF